MTKRRLQRLQTLRVKYSGTSVGGSNVVSKEKYLIFVSREKNSCLGRTTHPPLKKEAVSVFCISSSYGI
jgi:hypothetical protein